MKRKITALCVVIAMLAVAIIGGTMAYFTDTDDAVNVMTMGNVSIIQHEQERGETGLEDFKQAKPLFPATHVGVAEMPAPGTDLPISGGNVKVWANDIENEIDKIVTVENNGKSDAFVRTWLAFEIGDLSYADWEKLVHINKTDDADSEWTWAVIDGDTTVDGIDPFVIKVDDVDTKFVVMTATYNGKLAGGDTTLPSLIQVALDKTATQEQVASFGDTYEILAFSQAVQTAGFNSAADALKEAFTDEHPWQDGVTKPSYVSTASEFQKALAANESIVLTEDIDLSGTTWTSIAEYSGTLDGNGHSVIGLKGENGLFEMLNGATVKNLKIENATINASSNHTGILAGSIKKDADAPTTVIENVTVSGTVNGGGYYTGGIIGAVSSYHAEIRNCVNNATVTSAGQQVGGIVGYAKRDALIENCTNKGAVSGGAFVGGIIGLIAGDDDDTSLYVTIKGCTNEGTVTANDSNYSSYVGGIAGVCGREGGNQPKNEISAYIIGCDAGNYNICGGKINVATGKDELINLVIMSEVSGYPGLYKDEGGNCYVYDAEGLISLRNYWKANWTGNNMWGRTYNICANIDATGYTWESVWINVGSNTNDGIIIDGNGHTISNLTITGGSMFSGTPNGGDADTKPGIVRDITFDNATVSGSNWFNGVVWGNCSGEIEFNKVKVINSNVSGTNNVGAIIGSTGEFSDSATVTFIDCSVSNTKITANGADGQDPTGASAFIGRAYANTKLVFEGTNSVSGNTITNNNGLVGGGIYAYTIFDNNVEGYWRDTGSCDTFTNWNGIE